MAFLDQLASKVGSMHIDTDSSGRLRAVSVVPKAVSDRAATGASFVRVLFSSRLSTPLTLAELVQALVVWVPFLVIMGWVMLFFFGISPRRAWRLIKETYAAANGRGEHEIETLFRTEKFLLALFGPAIQILNTIAYCLDLMIGAVSVCVAFPTYPWICAIDPAALRIGDAIEQNVNPASSPSFKSGRGVALLGIAVAAFASAAAYRATAFFHIAIPDNTDWMVISMILVASLAVAPLLTRRFPKLAIHSFLAARFGFVRLVAKVYWLIRTRGLDDRKRRTDPYENTMEEVARLSPVFDVLRRRRPDLTADFARRYPELKDALEGRRILGPGSGEPGGTGAASDLAKTALVELKVDLNEVLQVLTRRVKLLARLRLAAGVVSSLSSAGMVAAVVGGTPHTQIITATITLLASLFGLVTVYLEDFSGGEGSTRRLRDLMAAQVRRLAEIDGQLRLALAQDDSAKILSSLTDISSVLGEVQYARAQLGLAI